MIDRFFRSFASAAICLVTVMLIGCGGGSSSPTPQSPSTATPTASATPSSTATMSADQVTKSLTSVQTYYATLPHKDLAADLKALAAQMVSSKAYKTAMVEPGGITSTLPDGSPALIFADRREDFESPAPSIRTAVAGAQARYDLPVSAPNAHEIAFLVNETDRSGAFVPSRQMAFARAFSQSGFTANNGYGVDAQDVTLENILALSSGHPIDFLSISTHGNIYGRSVKQNVFAFSSSTPITAANNARFASDLALHRVLYANTLDNFPNPVPFVQYAFTADFLTAHLTFNPGAIIDNQSCFGGYAKLNLLATSFGPVGAGRYLGWSGAVDGSDADESDAFLFDRLLGEQKPSVTGLDAYADQRPVPQRPFPFDDIFAAMQTEQRMSPIQGPRGYTYVHSYGGATLLQTTNGNGAADPPLLTALPSIATMHVDEGLNDGTLTIDGAFPVKPGTVTMTDDTGTRRLAATQWATAQITATLPASGAGSAGIVNVLDSSGIASNGVPLTQWTGRLVAREHDDIPEIDNIPGTGSGSIVTTFNVDFRSDVHPTAPTIDADAAPQNLYFPALESDSTARITTYSGSFHAKNSSAMATFSLARSASLITLGAQPLAPATFIIAPVSGQPAPCNNAAPGTPTGTGAGNIFCPVIGYISKNASVCSDNYSGVLCQFDTSPAAALGDGMTQDGLLLFTMNPSTYEIAISSDLASLDSDNFAGSMRPATGSVSGTIATPRFPPTGKTPAIARDITR